MLQISITIDNSNEVTVGQSATPTKVEKKNISEEKNISNDKTYFLVMRFFSNGYYEKAYPELITEDYNKACFLKKELEKYVTRHETLKILIQKNGPFHTL